MSTILYGGLAITRTEILEWEKTPVYHGPDLLYQRHRLRVRGCVNPGVNSWSLPGGLPAALRPAGVLGDAVNNPFVPQGNAIPGVTGRVNGILSSGLPGAAPAPPTPPFGQPVPGMAAGNPAALSEAMIRWYLAQPRRQLVVAVGTFPALIAPGPNPDGTYQQSDCDNGPQCTLLDIVAVSGTRSYLVDVGFECALRDDQAYVATPTALLSNRFAQSSELDQDFYEVVTSVGLATFNTGRLGFLNNAVPDDYRKAVLPPIPPNFQRSYWKIDPTPDGTSLRWATIDRQRFSNLGDTIHATRIEAEQEVGATKPAFGSIAGTVLEILSRRTSGALPVLPVPLQEVTVRCQVWGKPESTRTALSNTAIDIAVGRLAVSLGLADPLFALTGFSTAGLTVTLRHDLAGSWVGAEARALTSFAGGSIDVMGLTAPDAQRWYPNDDSLFQILVPRDGFPNPLPFNNPRSSYLGVLKASDPTLPNLPPATPVLPRNARDLTPP